MLASTRPAASSFPPPLIRLLGTVVGGSVGTDGAVVSFLVVGVGQLDKSHKLK